MKYLLLIPDGMADWEVKELGKKTPLEVADTPNINYLAKEGACGITKTIPDGFEPGSDIANLTILGVDVRKYYTGRGPIEALARDIFGDMVFRCNLVYVKDDTMIDYSGRRVDDHEALRIIKHLNKNRELDFIEFHAGRSYRNLMTVNGIKEEVKTTPPHDIQGKRIDPYMPKGGKLAKILADIMEWSKAVLSDLDVGPNMVWLWGGGEMPSFPKLKDRIGKTGVMISEVDLLIGIGKGLGMEAVEVEGATGYIDTNYKGLAKSAIRSLKREDFVVLHTEGIDEIGHEGDVEKKVEAITLYDEKIVGYILDHIDHEETRIMLLPDHPTPVRLKTHTAEEVPFLIYGWRRDDVRNFTEKKCRKGFYGFVEGLDLLNLFVFNK
ncbi:phosphoglycerate mutase [Archaeoglobus sulfaticallidus PM70-1]|uniref:phosphoglycerate mutase (2,3-diphosphoglycerate-independent) n=1 Tax=Archaeoglobus sulfaticallidus PM70-1 TaxID=387631 RepID=N0BAH7_9EURY|nr:cofactor-independent phosphoglycerate mutase [Archaeoglobus sulfaticallidus]AGK60609.1 phosphoglycerate mutase [Archaeoglobus sulfaticallidus PM70-1]